MESKITNYKGLQIYRNDRFNYIKISVTYLLHENIVETLDSLLTLVEAIECFKSAFLIVTNIDQNHRFKGAINNFIQYILIEQLKRIGLKKVILIVEEFRLHPYYIKLEHKRPLLNVHSSLFGAVNWIRIMSEAGLN